MKVVITGGTGFVGLNLAAVLLAHAHDVTLFDREPVSAAAQQAFSDHAGSLKAIAGDVSDQAAIDAVIAAGCEVLVLGAAITADAARDARDPETILQVNLLTQIAALQAARRHDVRRVIYLSSAAAYGASGQRFPVLEEVTPCDPVSLYAISKFASERALARLAGLWERDLLSVRLSAVFGRFERLGGRRDTPSPQAQILAAFERKVPAILPSPAVKDWVYARDVAEAVALLVEAERPRHRLYNISGGTAWSALQWGEAFAARHPGYECRLATLGEPANVDNGPERAPLSVERMAQEFGWRARFGCAESVADLGDWWLQHRRNVP